MRWNLLALTLALVTAGAGSALPAQDPTPPAPALPAQEKPTPPPPPPPAQEKQDIPPRKGDLAELTIEELMQIEVTSAAKKSERLMDTPAAVFVIRSEDIRRSGATTVAEALRMAPGINVGHIDSNKWAVSSRGFGDVFSNKLLVLMDGRTAYNPTFSGVYWDIQDQFLMDIDRIEVIRGPGATTWGANAVNGVINVITKSAKDSQGGVVTLGIGTSEQAFTAARYGARAGDDTYLKVYAKWFERADSEDGNDGWEQGRTGFRLDWVPPGPNSVTFQGDFYRGRSGSDHIAPSLDPPFSLPVASDQTVTGGNLLGRWQHTFAPREVLTVQGYYDRADRPAVWFGEQRDTLDLEVVYRFPVADIHDLTLGTGYRWTRGRFDNTFNATVTPTVKVDQISNVFLQDEIAIVKDVLSLTAGCKLEYNNYSHLEVEPTLRARWKLAENQVLWAAASRAVRTPSPAESNLRLNQVVFPGTPPTLVSIFGNRDFKSEVVEAYELGYRLAPVPGLSFDLALFHNEYDRLRSLEPLTPGFEATPAPAHILVPFTFGNRVEGHSYGVELATQWQVAEGVRLHLSYTHLRMDLHTEQGSGDTTSVNGERGDPTNQLYARLSLDLLPDLRLDVAGRYVSLLSASRVPSYLEADVRLAWDPTPNAEISIVGQNLVHAKHLEGRTQGLGIQSRPVERGVYVELTVKF